MESGSGVNWMYVECLSFKIQHLAFNIVLFYAVGAEEMHSKQKHFFLLPAFGILLGFCPRTMWDSCTFCNSIQLFNNNLLSNNCMSKSKKNIIKYIPNEDYYIKIYIIRGQKKIMLDFDLVILYEVREQTFEYEQVKRI